MANVRIFGYAGTVQLQQNMVRHYNSDSAFVRQEQYLWSQKLALNGATPVESDVQADDKATFVVVEVDDNVAVRYEVNPNGPAPASTHRDASTNSPKLQGEAPFQWFAGATMSFVDASTV
jgi:hypothetical protein